MVLKGYKAKGLLVVTVLLFVMAIFVWKDVAFSASKQRSLDFSHIYVLNLRKRTDRRDWMKKLLSACKVDYTLFYALDIHNPADIFTMNNWEFRNGRKINGEYAILLSEYLVLKDALAKGYKDIILLEDDVDFDASFSTVVPFIKQELPATWDTLHFFCSQDCKGQAISKHLNKILLDQWPTLLTVSNAYSQSGMKKSIEAIEKEVQVTPIDLILTRLIRDGLMEGYIVNPILVDHLGRSIFGSDNAAKNYGKYESNLNKSLWQFFNATGTVTK